MLSGVTVSCFLLSYLVVLAMEGSRFLAKVPGRQALLVGMLVAGLFAHSIFLINQFGATNTEAGPQVLANWFQWSVLGAWGVALSYLILAIRNPQGGFGLFLIPIILILIGLGQLLRGSAPFNSQTTVSIWSVIHGVSLLLGTMVICLGLAFGVMYLVQSYRLKKKLSSSRIRLPTLEFLQSMNRLSLFVTSIALAVGVISGFVLNVSQGGPIAWFSTGILFTCGLFGWSTVASTFELAAYRSLGGRRSAYLAIGNFVFLALVLGLLIFSSHGFEPTVSQSTDTALFRDALSSPDTTLELADFEVSG